jgi:hypothetical protein
MINRTIPSPTMHDLAKRLLAYEAAMGSSSAENTAAVFSVSEKLRRPLSTLAGTTGFRALLGRALMLAKVQVPELRAVQVKPDGSLDGFGELRNRDQAAEAGIILIAQLLGLLVVFIGENLMLRLILDVWPDFPVFDTEPRKGDYDPTR